LQAEAAGPGVHRVKEAVGLYLNKAEGDAGSWFHRYRFCGKRREIGLGALVTTSLIEARKKLADIVAQRNAGRDPIVVRRAAKIAAAHAARAEEGAANKWTFKVAVEDYLAAHVGSWKGTDARRVWHGPFVRYAYPIFGTMLLDDIKVDHIVAVMNACSEADGRQAARPHRAGSQRRHRQGPAQRRARQPSLRQASQGDFPGDEAPERRP
jgi:hypothetical protein